MQIVCANSPREKEKETSAPVRSFSSFPPSPPGLATGQYHTPSGDRQHTNSWFRPAAGNLLGISLSSKVLIPFSFHTSLPSMLPTPIYIQYSSWISDLFLIPYTWQSQIREEPGTGNGSSCKCNSQPHPWFPCFMLWFWSSVLFIVCIHIPMMDFHLLASPCANSMGTMCIDLSTFCLKKQ